jgi:hypothetical protein
MGIENLSSIIDELDFDLAFSRVKNDMQYDFIQLPIEYRIFESDYSDNIAFIKGLVKENKYIVKRLRKMWVQKKNYFLRPGSIPHFSDRLIFQALIDKVADKLEDQLPPLDDNIVYSSRLNRTPGSEKMFIHPKGLWLKYKKRTVDLCDDPKYKSVLVSDIASYFENIDLRLLIDTLQSIGIHSNYTQAIHHFLSIWANGRTKGLPQMLAPCSLLANIYLSQVDKNMVMKGYQYIRYVDDIRIYVDSDPALRKCLLDLTEQLKLIYLDVQASKTKFVPVGELKNEMLQLETHLHSSGIEIRDESGEYFIELSDAIQSSEVKVSVSISEEDDETIIPEDKLRTFLDKILFDSEYEDRNLRFCLNNLAKIKSNIGIEKTISYLSFLPQETATFVNYYLKLNQDAFDRANFEKIFIFLESDYNIYDWQMMWLLFFIIKSPLIIQSDINRLYRNTKLFNHFINRALLYYLICLKGDLTSKREIMSKYPTESSIEVKYAILSGLYALDSRERNRFYTLATQEREINQLIKVLKNHECPFI